MMYRIFLFLLLTCSQLSAQQEFGKYEDSLKYLGIQALKGKSENERTSANDKFIEVFKRALTIPESFDYGFDSLKTISNLKAENEKFRIFTWHVRLDDGTFNYYGFIQNTVPTYQLFELKDQTPNIKMAESAALDNNKWYGAHYYKIVPSGKGFLLLGWKGNDLASTKKVIEPLSFSRDGKPKFGSSVFTMKGNPKRIIFEYSSQISMSLKYDENQKMIVFDHLAPTSPNLKGQYQFYTPDMSYDGLQYRKGKWVYKEDLDARNPKNEQDRKFNDPK